MRKLLFAILIIGVYSVGYSQEEIDQRLLERYSKNELTQMQQSNPEEYIILQRALEVGIKIMDYREGEEKAEKIPFEGVLEVDLQSKPTYISLGLELKDRTQYFRIKDSNKMLVVYPKDIITKIK